jgi:hypothetical protein
VRISHLLTSYFYEYHDDDTYHDRKHDPVREIVMELGVKSRLW